MIDPRKQLALMNLLLAGWLLGYSVEYTMRFIYTLVHVAGQYFQQ